MKQFLTLITFTLALTSCSEKNPANAVTFQNLIAQSPQARQQICRNVMTGMEVFGSGPKVFEQSNEAENFFQKYRTLEANGYVTIERVQTQDLFGGGMIDGLKVSLTDKWEKNLGSPYSGERCVAEWTAQKVVKFTPPVSNADGSRTSTAEVQGAQAYTGWASVKDIQQVFGMTPLPQTALRYFTMIQPDKNSPWQISNVR